MTREVCIEIHPDIEYNALLDVHKELCKALPINDLFPSLISLRVISIADKEKLCHGRTEQERAEEFIEKHLQRQLSVGVTKQFYDFMNALQESDKGRFLVTKIRERISHHQNKATVTGSKSSLIVKNKNQVTKNHNQICGSTKDLFCLPIILSILISSILTATFLYMLHLPMVRQQAYLEHKVILLQSHIDSANFDHRVPINKYERKQFQLEIKDDLSTAPLHYHQSMIPSSNRVAPIILIMSNFTEMIRNNETWKSKPFFAFDGGYLMYLSVYANGNGNSTHVSVFLHLMQGPYDDDLQLSGQWPLRGTFTIELLNQSSSFQGSHHYGYILKQHYQYCLTCTCRNMDGDKDPLGWGFSQFISHKSLLTKNNSNYLQNNTLQFRISYLYSNTVLNEEDFYEISKVYLQLMLKIIAYHLWYMFAMYAILLALGDLNSHFEIKMQYYDAISLSNIILPLLILEAVLAAFVMLTYMTEHMKIDDTISVALNCSLLRLLLVAGCNYLGYIVTPYAILFRLSYRTDCKRSLKKVKQSFRLFKHNYYHHEIIHV